MVYALSWLLTFSLFAVWSLSAWTVNAIAVWAVSNATTVTSAASSVKGLLLPEWMAPWIPSEVEQEVVSMLSAVAPILDSVVQAAPELAGGLALANGVVWGIGSALLLLLGAGLHLLISMWYRRTSGFSSQSVRQPSA